ncbi:MAG: SCP2 sterol-binding domain-containing protein [Nitrososphaerota archaeon]|nr:SCP2 sterol-binding domain-containing protein [Nitrososphaerota archaeon]
MSSSDQDAFVAKVRRIADANFPAVKDKLPSTEQVYVVKTEEGLSLVVAFSSEGIRVEKGDHPQPISTMTMSQADLDLLLQGQLDGVKAFLRGRVRVQGDVFKTMALNSILKGAQ